MTIAKSYKLLNFLNRDHSKLTRVIFGTLAFLGVFTVTRNIKLSLQVWRGIQRNDFKTSLRRCGWYAYNGWPGVKLIDDPYFDFTEGLSVPELEIVSQFNQRNKLRGETYRFFSNELYIAAAKIHFKLTDADPEIYDLVENFYVLANELVKEIDKMEIAQYQPLPIFPTFDQKFSANAKEALEKFSNCFPISEWRWYVISGTFLGLIREHGFLGYYIDIDLGINAEDFNFENFLRIVSTSTEFVMRKIDGQIEISRNAENGFLFQKRICLIKLIHVSGINLDIFIHYKDGCMRWHGSTIHRWENKDFTLTPSILEGVKVLCPSDADTYLTENYGDWRTPKYDFNCSTDTPNLVITRNFLSIAIFLKRLAFQMSTDQEQGLKFLNMLIKNRLIEQTDKGIRVRKFI